MLVRLFTLFAVFSFFSSTAQLTFGPAQLIDIEDGVVTVYSADFDNDGDIDLLSTSTIDGISWWSNDGAGNFTLGQYLQQTGDIPLSKAAAIADYDNDGDLDVLAIINTENSTSPTSIQYFINDGVGGFTSGFIVGFVGPNAQEIIPVDLDQDGDMDAVFAEGADDQVGWVENNGGSFNAPVVFFTTANGAQTVACGDYDQDGDIDIMAAGEFDDTWRWFPNSGSETFPFQFTIGTGDNVSSIVDADLDGDGFEDGLAVYAIDGDVVWAANNGDGSGFSPAEFILDGPGFPANFPITVEATDLDQDGDIDPVVCSILDNTISWYSNQGGGTFNPQEILATGANNVRQVAFGDFDGDTDIDMAAALFGSDQLVWYENTSAVQIPGCTDPTACNYDPNATQDDGSCDFSCFGCTDANACNFDPLATIDDGSCEIVDAWELDWNGATTFCPGDGESSLFDPGIINNGNGGQNQRFVIVLEDGTIFLQTNTFFIDLATLDAGIYDFYIVNYQDGLTGLSEGLPFSGLDGCFAVSAPVQITILQGGCTDPGACNFDPDATCSLDTCDFSCLGCTDSGACNFDPVATQDDGSCEFESCAGCQDPTACNFDPDATIDSGACDFCSCVGCTDPLACNYNAQATTDDGSCYTFPEGYNCDGTCIDADMDGICDIAVNAGCTDPLAINYQLNATQDDGSCILANAICGLGTEWDPNLQQCVAIEEPVCPGDFNGDLVINTTDLLQFLIVFATSCE